MGILLIVITVFIVGGLFVIALAPAFNLFRKAGRGPWRALIPGANIVTLSKMSGWPLGKIGLISFIVFPLVSLAVFIPQIQAENTDVAALLPPALLWLAALLVSTGFLYVFPMLSTFMLVFAALLAGTTAGRVESIVPAVILIGLGAMQGCLDYFGWKKLLKKFNRPGWHIVFLVVPVLAALGLAAAGLVTSLLGASLGLPVFLGVSIPCLFVGFMYYYYLGYSPKVLYQAD